MASVVPDRAPMPMKYGKSPAKKGGKPARGKKPPMPMKGPMPMEPTMPMAPPFRKLSSAGRRAAV